MDPGLETLPRGARVYTVITTILGMVVLCLTLANWESADLLKFSGFLLAAISTSGMRISVPGIGGPLPLNFVFVLLGVLDLTSAETILLAAIVTCVQVYWNHPRHGRLFDALSAISPAILAAAIAENLYHAKSLAAHGVDPNLRLTLATVVLFFFNTALDRNGSMLATWRERVIWYLPYYLGGAVVAKMASLLNRSLGWQTVLLIGPVVYLIYRSYRLYLDRLENEKQHAEEVSGLHLRTIEALALAIEAKDHTTHDHLQRVQVYAMELAQELGLTHQEREALRAASILHDIGKLAVPEHIISKPGRLTPEEFEKMKIHPIVGGEILERVQFPYPVVPIVRAHHEKWDGTGYPCGLAGEAIPIGARILAAVDCLDALASDRQYRRALPLDEAMKIVQSESGKAFDPMVVEALSGKYIELERKAQIHNNSDARLSIDLKVERGDAPAAGFEATQSSTLQGASAPMDFLTSIAAARQEVQALFEISQDLGNSLSLDETLSVLAVRLRKIIPHHSLAIWIKRGSTLQPDYVSGDDFRLFSTLEIPLGQGLSGWVAENRKPILNGNPSVEPGYLNDSQKFSTLRAAVAVPLEGMNGVLGVLSLYHAERDAFTKDHLRILLAISAKIGMSIENALRFRQAESSATTDYLTTLPNARSLFLQLDAELSRSRRGHTSLSVLVLDLDGFKQVNDRFGHLEGNKVLYSVAKGLKGSCREYDYVARMGGDEFVVLLPNVDPADVPGKVGQLRSVVHEIGSRMFSTNTLTASIGVAHFPSDGADAEELLAAADRQMYEEKRSRRHARPSLGPAWKSDWAVTIQ